ncbi:MAG: class I SAM-dependent methyltransferase [Thermomicrobiales bacterium]
MTFHSTWGLFSPESVDQGSELLINHLEIGETDATIDVGCGYGPIGLSIARLAPSGTVHLIDKDFVAVEYAKTNARLNHLSNCEIYLSNAFSAVPDRRFDNVVSNLPGRVSNELLWIIFADAKAHLKPGGKLYVVTISRLREFIKRSFMGTFGNYDKLAQNKTYTVSVAVKK